jgi:PAS domain S-box-containing protein
MNRVSAVDTDRSLPVMVHRVAPAPDGSTSRLTQIFLLVVAAGCAAGALLLGLLGPSPVLTAPIVAVYALCALAAVLAARSPPTWRLPTLTAIFVALAINMGLAAVRMEWGLAGLGLALLPMMICALATLAGWRAGALMMAASMAAALCAAYWHDPGVQIAGGPGTGLRLLTYLIADALALAAGAVLSRVVSQAVQAALTREDRFRRLLGLAADVYWEIDSEYRLVAAGQQMHELRALQPQSGLGSLAWELPRFVCDAETLDLLMADLETRSPFRDLPFSWRNRDGQLSAYLASGEPRFDARGLFKGYWGVARDVTAVQAARAELQATETRYQELFACLPSPLVLHRRGRVLDANPAAVNFFGHSDLESMIGSDLYSLFDEAESRERAQRRVEHLLTEPDGAALPVANFRLRVGNKPLMVQSSGVKVRAQGSAAVLSIFVDITERLAAEDAVRRSEGLLAHLVATSPDVITLTDSKTGRYAMVNQAFERHLGFSAAEAIGRTAIELGVWGSEASREQFLDRLKEADAVADLPVTFVSKSGEPVPLRVSAARFVLDRRDYLVINARDVSAAERDRMERAAILDNASIGIAVTRQQHFVLTNRHFEQMLRWSVGSLLGEPSRIVWPTDEDHAEIGRLTGPTLARGEAVELETTLRRRDGTLLTARLHARAIDPEQPERSDTVWIVEDVTERRQFEKALARARDDAEAANRAKSAFLANTSHELRTPLNAMLGLARMAAVSDVDETLRRRYLDQIADSAQSLAGIISDILDLSKIEAGKLQLETTSFDLAELLHSLEQTYQTLAAAHGLTLRFEVDEGLRQPVSGDPLRVRQIVTNYLSNAIKFTSQGGVRVRADRLPGGAVRIEVIDTGPGIEEAAQAHLFRPFTQADQSTTRRFGGTGLGLSICRELALLMGGDVGVDGLPGQGSCFWALLPLPPTGAAPLPPSPTPTPPSDGDLKGLRVLMAEDNAVNMLIAVSMLERWGVEVQQAQDGQEAVAAVERAAASGQPFHAVLMDVQMPKLSGHDATRQLRLVPAGQGLPIIALTAAALVTEREEALSAGMNDFLTKPIDANKLHATLLRYRPLPVGG